MIAQTQFLALTSRIGGPDAQPAQTRAISEGLSWSNMHFFKIPYSNSTQTTSPANRDAGEDIDGDDQERNCRLARESDRELGAALLVSLSATVGSYFLRVFFNELIRWLNKRKGEIIEHDVLPFPVWELQVFLITFTGVAESTGIAIASGCRAYEILGAFILLFVVCFLGFMLAVVVMAVWTGCIKWRSIKWKDAWAKAKEEFAKRKQGKTWAHKLNQFYLAYLTMDNRGEWEVDEDNPRAKVFGHRFLERMGGAFDSYRGGSWWFGFWGLIKALIMCLVLAMIFSPSANALLVLIINGIDYVLIMFRFPDAQWADFIQNTYKASVNMTLLASIFAYVEGAIPEDVYAGVFQILVIVSIIPTTIAAILGPIVNLIRHFKALGASLIGLCAVGGIGGTCRAICCANWAVLYGDDFVQTQVLEAMDKEDTTHKHERFIHAHRHLPGHDLSMISPGAAGAAGALGAAGAAHGGLPGASRATARAEPVTWGWEAGARQAEQAGQGRSVQGSQPAPAISFTGGGSQHGAFRQPHSAGVFAGYQFGGSIGAPSYPLPMRSDRSPGHGSTKSGDNIILFA